MKNFLISLILSISLINSSFAYNYYESGKEEFKKGNYLKANELFQSALKENPENLKCRYFYAQSFIGIDNLVKAQQQYEKVIEQAPNSELSKLSSIAISKIHEYYSEKNKKPLKTKSSKINNDPIKPVPDVKLNSDAINGKNIQDSIKPAEKSL